MVLVSILSFFLTPLRWVREIIYSQSLRRKAVQIMIACAVLVLLITVSFFAYLSFYWVYIPQRGHIGRVHLQYDKISPSGLPIAPSAVVDFAEGGRYGQTLRSDQAYDISMKLVMPTSSTNVAIGNFMVMVQLIGVNGSVIISSCRPDYLESDPVSASVDTRVPDDLAAAPREIRGIVV
ncbi:Berardinelli-Seip congenital lipodystrophy 2 (seipin) [Linnemannia zychae]|nr:Berardinelli-Seip congenital lipodystrophy 2 (seipin) [Linnemannia zychae]